MEGRERKEDLPLLELGRGRQADVDLANPRIRWQIGQLQTQWREACESASRPRALQSVFVGLRLALNDAPLSRLALTLDYVSTSPLLVATAHARRLLLCLPRASLGLHTLLPVACLSSVPLRVRLARRPSAGSPSHALNLGLRALPCYTYPCPTSSISVYASQAQISIFYALANRQLSAPVPVVCHSIEQRGVLRQ